LFSLFRKNEKRANFKFPEKTVLTGLIDNDEVLSAGLEEAGAGVAAAGSTL
jgi:hypothetical protein